MSRKLSNAELSLEEIVDYEKRRYVRKGYGLIFAVITTLIWFLLIPKMFKYFWPNKIENPGKYFFFIVFITHEGIFIVSNFIMWIIYKLESNFFERYKIHDKPWPWKSDPDKWDKLLRDTFIMLFINQVIVMPISIIQHYLDNISPYRVDFESLPASFEVIWQTIVFMICEDFLFYWAHRFLHHDKLYPYIHKIHHQHQNTVSIASEYSHPVEFFFSNLLTTNLTPLLMGKRVHLATYLLWVVLRVGETTDGHCGYEFSWSPYRLLPMSGSSEFHNYHHLNFKGNYGSFFTYWDRICKTVNQKYIDFSAKKKEILEKQKEDRAKKD